MNWFNRWRKKKHIDAPLNEEQAVLFREIEKAKAEWLRAQSQFDEAHGQDQVDYSIYLLEAAEKRYELLLRQAKILKLNALGKTNLHTRQNPAKKIGSI